MHAVLAQGKGTYMHALIIEDEPLIQLMIKECLIDAGYSSFDVASTVSEAISAAAAFHPDLITSDARLPDGVGMDAVSTICSLRPAPVLYVVGNEFDLGITEPGTVVLTKPFTFAQFSEAVAQAADRFGKHRAA